LSQLVNFELSALMELASRSDVSQVKAKIEAQAGPTGRVLVGT
jgi:hypothetical protein